MRRKPAFTLIELLVVVSIIALLVTILVPVVTSGLDDTRKAVCATNLKTIGGAFRDYLNDDKTPDFPRLADNGDVNDGLLHSNTLDATNLGTNTMQNVWLLIEEAYLSPPAFHCPADGGWLTRTANTKYGWEYLEEFSYGMQCPYVQNVAAAVTNKADPAHKDYKANWVFMADMNPGGAVVKGGAIGHSNHTYGFNYITRVGNLEFHEVDGVNADDPRSLVYGEEIYADTGAAPGVAGDGYGDAVDDVIITPTDGLTGRAQ